MNSISTHKVSDNLLLWIIYCQHSDMFPGLDAPITLSSPTAIDFMHSLFFYLCNQKQIYTHLNFETTISNILIGFSAV